MANRIWPGASIIGPGGIVGLPGRRFRAAVAARRAAAAAPGV
ncbi:MAG: hypothetical protein RQ752_12915 [Thermohalobaculum sp.]|nr:hypothetical protein [Thermohalobaculum sp.]